MVVAAAERIFDALKSTGVDFFGLFPCEKTRRLYNIITKNLKHVNLSREEEGVGICAGASLAGVKPAMLVQSSGIGNMINALCSLTKTYEFPLPILASWRGVYKERIPAQIPFGKSLPKVLGALDIKYAVIRQKKHLSLVSRTITDAYARNEVRIILLSPEIWGDEAGNAEESGDLGIKPRHQAASSPKVSHLEPMYTRFEILKMLSPYLENKIVVCNLGIPSKELYSIKHQKSNFYMLGSMGLASSIGLGLSMSTTKEVVVIEGDGSLLTNLGSLSTIAAAKPRNLTIFAIDNGVHGSTGNQPTATGLCVDLELTARGLGLQKTYQAANGDEIRSTIQELTKGPNFVHLIAKPGNADVADVPLSPPQIKKELMRSLRE